MHIWPQAPKCPETTLHPGWGTWSKWIWCTVSARGWLWMRDPRRGPLVTQRKTTSQRSIQITVAKTHSLYRYSNMQISALSCWSYRCKSKHCNDMDWCCVVLYLRTLTIDAIFTHESSSSCVFLKDWFHSVTSSKTVMWFTPLENCSLKASWLPLMLRDVFLLLSHESYSRCVLFPPILCFNLMKGITEGRNSQNNNLISVS